GQALHDPARRPLPRLSAADDHAGAAATAPAGGGLAADRERQRAQPRLHGRPLHQGRRLRHRRERRPALVRRLPGRRAPSRSGAGARRGSDPRLRMSIDDTVDAAIRRARPYFEEHAKFMAPLGMLRYSEEHVSAVAARQAQSASAATLENGARNRSWLCGPSRDIVAYLKELEARYPGLEHIMIAWALS